MSKRFNNSINNNAPRAKRARQEMTSIVSKPSLEGMDMMYLCHFETAAAACAPLKNSDLLLQFLSEKHYDSEAFIESIFFTLQKMIPKARFLHPIHIQISKEDEEPYITITKHAGRSNVDSVALNVIDYSVKYIQADADDMSLMAIPLIIDYDADDNHANMLIIDPRSRTCEHFEPHGKKLRSRNSDEDEMNRKIEHAVVSLCNEWYPDFVYIPRNDATNFQAILNDKFAQSEHGGTCQVWSIWYAYLRLSHPEFKRETIIRKSRELLGQNDFAELEHFIMKFITQLNSILGLSKVGNVFYNVYGRKYN